MPIPEITIAISNGASFFIGLSQAPPALCLARFISIPRCWSRLGGQASRGSLLVRTRPFLNHVENRRNKENSQRTRGAHPADNRCTHDLSRHGTRARRRPQWHATQDERKRSHQNRPETQPGAFERRIRQRLALFELLLCKLDDQNRILGSQADEHHQPYLRVHIALHLHQVWRQKYALQEAAQE